MLHKEICRDRQLTPENMFVITVIWKMALLKTKQQDSSTYVPTVTTNIESR